MIPNRTPPKIETVNKNPLENVINNQIIQSQSQQRLNSNEELFSDTKITDLYFDCIERICYYLDGDDILNLCEAHELLKESVRVNFADEFENRIIKLYSCGYELTSNWYSSYMHNCINCSSIERFIYHFGDKFIRLSIDFHTMPNPEAIITLILKYCTKSLIELKFCRLNTIDLSIIPGSLSNLERLTFVKVSIQQIDFKRLFPNLEHFELISMSLLKWDSESLVSPKLLTFIANISSAHFNLDHFKMFLKRNKKIRTLQIDSLNIPATDQTLMAFIKKALPYLNALHLAPETYKHFDYSKTIKFPYAKELSINLFDAQIHGWKRIPFTFKNLEKLEFRRIEQWSSHLFDFVCKHHRTLSILEISAEFSLSRKPFILELNPPTLFELIELNLNNIFMRREVICKFIKKCASLRKICFRFECKDDFDVRKVTNYRYGSQWAVSLKQTVNLSQFFDTEITVFFKDY